MTFPSALRTEIERNGEIDMQFIKFLASTTGRWIRIIAGVVFIGIGLLIMQNTAGIILAIVGLVPLLAGILDFCVFAPLFGASFSGKAIRTST